MVLKEADERVISAALGRRPNDVESAIFENLWSEHCAYRTSKPLLQTMPTRGDIVIVGPGDDAAIIKLSDHLTLAIAMESHNHPWYVNPSDGAATGVGGIVRDIISMGAKPIALMDCLYFGSLKNEKNRYLFEHVVQGIGDYGNCIGVPVVNGEVLFHPSYDGNPLVNVVCIGLGQPDTLVTGRVKEPGSKIILIGSATGRDGLGGASFSSEILVRNLKRLTGLPSIGDPYTEKLLIDATLEAVATGYVFACRDLGAAGLSGASAEMCSTFGGRIVLDAVPLREAGMTPREIMVSESQERMVLEVPPEHVQEILAIARKYDLNGAIIGEVINEPRYVVEFRGMVVADIPIKLLTEGAPLCTPERPKAQSHLEQPQARDLTLKEKAVRVLSSPNVATKEWVYRQYDHEVQTRTIVKPGSGAAVLSIDARRGIALSSGCNPTHVAKDQFQGAAGTVFENAMNLAVKGATPVAFVNCLNFGNPENADVFSQLERAVAGLSHAARILDTPIVGGNVSLYNESEEFHTAIIPTPSIGMVGILEDVSTVPPAVFQEKGDIVMMIGETYAEYGGSEYDEIFEIGGAVPQPRETIKTTIDALVKVVETGKITAATDISRGGIIAALGKMCKHVGAEVNLSGCLDNENELFSESSGRAILTVIPGSLNSVSAVLEAHDVPHATIGTVGGGALSITVGDSQLTLSLEIIERSLNTLNESMIA